MPVVAVRQLVQGQGVNKDVSPNVLPPNAFSDIVNARFSRGRLERFGGTQIFAQAPTVPEIDEPRFLEGFVREGSEGLVLVSDDAVYTTVNGTTWTDRTPAGGISDADDWNLSQYGDWLILTSLQGTNEPIVLAPGGTLFITMTNWPATYQAQKIFPYKNILIAIGIEINNNVQSGLVKWSDVVNVANLDTVDWDPANPASLAGENTLPDRDGDLRDGGVLRDSALLYTDASVWRIDLTNTTVGITPTVFNFRKIFSDDGIYKNRCFVESEGKHYVVGRFDIYTTDGFQRQTIADNRMTEFFFQRIGTEDNVFVAHYQRRQEIVICYSIDGNTEASEAMVFNYYYNTWTIIRFDDSAGFFTHFAIGPEFAVSAPTWAELQTAGTLWSDLNATTWNQLFPQSRDRVPYLLGEAAEAIYLTDIGGQGSSVVQVEMTVERRDLDFDEQFGNVRSIKHIKKFIPLVTGEGTIRIQFGGRDALNQPIVWQPEQIYTIGTDYKLDLRISHRFPAIRILQDADEGTFVYDGFDLDIQARSKR